MALHPPAKCQHCGHVFNVDRIRATNATNITFRGGKTNCPKCNRITKTADGTFDFLGDKVRLVSGPQSTADLLRILTQTVKDSVAANEAPEKTIDRIGEIDVRLLRFRKFAIPAVIAIARFLDWASHANTAYDLYDTLIGNKAQQEYSQQVKASKEGARQALEEFYATKEYQELKKQLDQDLPPPRPVNNASGSPGLKLHPVLVDLPITMHKLAEYEKSRRKGD